MSEYKRPTWTLENISLQKLLEEDNKCSAGVMLERLREMSEADASNAIRCYMTGIMTGMELVADLLQMTDDQILEAVMAVGERLSEGMREGVCLACATGAEHDEIPN